METIDIILPCGKKCSVQVVRKVMKTCRLKVFPDGSVSLSLPIQADNTRAEAFLLDKANWIERKIEGFSKTTGYAATNEIHSGFSITMLGKDMVFSVSKAERNGIVSDGNTIHILVTDINNQQMIQKVFHDWWRTQAKEIISQRVDQWYPVIRKYGVARPKVFIRKMNTLWGSCSATRGVVTFNLYLIKAKTACIDYVVLHELTHFLYPNHSKMFYAFLSSYMPDWKERKRILDQEVVHGL